MLREHRAAAALPRRCHRGGRRVQRDGGRGERGDPTRPPSRPVCRRDTCTSMISTKSQNPPDWLLLFILVDELYLHSRHDNELLRTHLVGALASGRARTGGTVKRGSASGRVRGARWLAAVPGLSGRNNCVARSAWRLAPDQRGSGLARRVSRTSGRGADGRHCHDGDQ